MQKHPIWLKTVCWRVWSTSMFFYLVCAMTRGTHHQHFRWWYQCLWNTYYGPRRLSKFKQTQELWRMVARGRGVNWSVSDTINILDGGTDVSETLNMAREFASGGDFWVGGNLLACLWWYWSHEPFSTIRSEMGQELNDTWNYFKPFRFSENSSKIENRGGFGNFRKKSHISFNFSPIWKWMALNCLEVQ